MSRKARIASSLTTVVLLTALVAATPSFAENDLKLGGSWETVSGGGNPGLIAYDADGTLLLTSPEPGLKSAIGVWERTNSPRTFSAKVVGYTIDSDRNPEFKFTARETIVLSVDGQSYVSEFTSQVTLLDGTPIATVSGTITATRIILD